MTVTRAVLLVVVIVLGLPIVGVALLYAYRTQSPVGPLGASGQVFLFPLLSILLSILIPLAVLFLVVYAAVRLAIKHERESSRGSSR